MHRPTDTWDGTGEDEDDRWDVEWSTGPLRLDEDEPVELEGDEDEEEVGAAEAYAAAREERRRRLREERARLVRRRRRRAGLVLVLVPAAVVAVLLARQLQQPSLTLAGPPSGALLGQGAAADLRFAARGEPGELRWVLDGRPVTPRATTTGLLVLRPRRLREGEHTLAVTRPGGHLLAPSTTRTVRFRVDATPPLVHLARPAVALPGQPLNVTGTVEAGATLKADGRTVPVRDGRFALHLTTPPRQPLTLQARDGAGNVSRWRMPVFVGARRPRRPCGRARHGVRLGRRHAAPGRARPDRGAPHQRGRDRPEGRGRDRRLRRGDPARASHRRRAADLRPAAAGRAAAREAGSA